MAVRDQLIGDKFAIYNGDCMDVMQAMPDGCVHHSIYSPPFGGLYHYSSNERDLSNCRSYQEFFVHYNFVIAEIARLTGQPDAFCVNRRVRAALAALAHAVGGPDTRAGRKRR